MKRICLSRGELDGHQTISWTLSMEWDYCNSRENEYRTIKEMSFLFSSGFFSTIWIIYDLRGFISRHSSSVKL